MEFLGYKMTMPGLKTVAERFGPVGSPATAIDLRKHTVADAREGALNAMAEADKTEAALDAARHRAGELRTHNDAERHRLRGVAHSEREAADDAPSRGLARTHDVAAQQAERDIAELDEEDSSAEAKLEPLELAALAKRRLAHAMRARALRVLRDAAYAHVQLEISEALSAEWAIDREFERRRVRLASFDADQAIRDAAH